MSLPRWSVTLLTALVALVTIAPLLWMVSVSFMVRGEAAQFPPPLWPASPSLENYRMIFGTFGVGRFLFNSILVPQLPTGLALLFPIPPGYAFSQIRSTGRDTIFRLRAAAFVSPGQTGQPRRH